jgi:hypothetical protein
MASYILPIAALTTGVVANLAIRKVGSNTVRLLIATPSMVLMLGLILLWLH